MGTAAATALVGRASSLARLAGALDNLGGDGPRVVLVSGEAGVGKTRLVSELKVLAAECGVSVAVGRCLDAGAAIWPLAPLREIFAAWADELSTESLDEVLGPAGEMLRALLHDDDFADSPGGDRLGGLVLGAVRRRDALGPNVLVFEDLHWADESTRALFVLLTRVHHFRHTLIVGTYRADELHRRHPLRPTLAEVARRARPERVSLEPLDLNESTTLLAEIGIGDATVVAEMHRRSGGNPFFLEELAAAHRAGFGGVSETLRDVVLARSVGLDECTIEVARTLAIAGAAGPKVLASAGGISLTAATAALKELTDAALVVAEGDLVRFRHELGREVFDGEVGHGQRPSVHAALAAALTEFHPERAGEIAYHWLHAGDQPQALAAAVAAGRQALGAGAAAEAEAHFGIAVDLWERVPGAADVAGSDHPGLLVEAAVAAYHAKHIDPAIDLCVRAAAELYASDPLRQADVWLRLRDLYRFRGRAEDCADALEHALALLPRDPPSRLLVKALADAVRGAGYANRIDEVNSFAAEAVAAGEALGDHEMLLYARNAQEAAMCDNDDPRAVEQALATFAMCSLATPPETMMVVGNGVIQSSWKFGRYAEIPAVAARCIDVARATGLAGARSETIAHCWIGVNVTLGNWAEAERLTADLRDIIDPPIEEGTLGAWYAPALIRQGRLGDARPLVERCRSVLQRGLDREVENELAAAVIEFDAADGRPDEAAALATAHLARTPVEFNGRPDVVLAAATVLADLAEHARAAHDQATIDRLDGELSRWIETIEQSPDRNAFLYAADDFVHFEQAKAELARLRGASSAQAWTAVAEKWADLAVAYEQACCRFRAAQAHLAGTLGRAKMAHDAAATELAAARSIATRLGAQPLLAQIDDLAKRARLTTDRAPPAVAPPTDSDPLGLTRRERLVLDLLAQGRTNGQIGKALYISTKTASVHVSAILRKLGVANRVEAAAIAQRATTAGDTT